jgi:hypothetical protein
MDLPPFNAAQRARISLIAESYRRLLGRPLADEPDNVEALWSAPGAIVAHGTEADPIFFFGNRTALRLFEMPFADFTRLPSRLSAEPLLREDRARLLERVSRDGFIEDYAGVRISAKGARFRIERAVVWNLIDSTGMVRGQAAAFEHWTPIQES